MASLREAASGGSDRKGHLESERFAHNTPCRVDVSGQQMLRGSQRHGHLLAIGY